MSPQDSLRSAAEKFADDIGATIAAVVGPHVTFHATGLKGGDKFSVTTADPDGIPLTVEGVVRLRLKVTMRCGWDGPGHWLAVHGSEFHVMAEGDKDPLFRYEFVKNGGEHLPTAHLHIHAHRDLLTYAMSRTGTRTKRGQRRGRLDARAPRISELHFPLGGRRFRPGIEDVLQMLVEEFGVDAEEGWRVTLQEGRIGWRRIQLQAAVRDDAEGAVETLASMGYTVTPPEDGHPPSDRQHLAGF